MAYLSELQSEGKSFLDKVILACYYSFVVVEVWLELRQQL